MVRHQQPRNINMTMLSLLKITPLLSDLVAQWYKANAGNPAQQAVIVEVDILQRQLDAAKQLVEIIDNQKEGVPYILEILRLVRTPPANDNTAILGKLDEILAILRRYPIPGPAKFGKFVLPMEDIFMGFVLGDDQKVTAGVQWLDAKGQQTTVDGKASFASSDEAVATVVDNGDDTVTIMGGAVGACQITARADAARGDGVTEVIATLDLEVVAGQAVSGTLVPGAPEPQ